MFRSLFPITLSLCTIALAADSPQWRGPNRDGKSTETGLLAQWPAGGPRLVWKAQGLGEGYSSFAVVGNRLYTQGQQGDREFVLALDVATGKQLWKTPTGRALSNDKGNGPRGTPTVDGNRLYAVAGDGTLVCLATDTGKRVWGTSFVDDFKGREPHWGYSESPLVEGDRVIVTPGGSGASIVALNKATGAVIWKSQSDGGAGGERGQAAGCADIEGNRRGIGGAVALRFPDDRAGGFVQRNDGRAASARGDNHPVAFHQGRFAVSPSRLAAFEIGDEVGSPNALARVRLQAHQRAVAGHRIKAIAVHRRRAAGAVAFVIA